LTPQHLRPRAKFVEQFAVEADSLDNSKHVALTSLLPGEKVRHTWKMVNPSDTITWPVGVVAKSVGGDDFVISTKKWKPYNPLKPKEVVEIVVEATAPTKPGRYIHYWRLHEENGAPFGDRIWLDMTVVLSRKMVTSKVVKKVVSIPSPIIEKKTVGGKENEKVIVTPISAKPKEEVIVVGKTNEPEAAGCEDKKIAAVQVEKKKTMEDSTNTNVLDEKEGENTAVLSPDDRDLPNIEKELSDAVSTASTTQSLSNPDQEWDMLHTGSFDDNMVTAESMIRLEKYKSELDTLSSMGFSDRDLLIQLLDEHNGDTQKVITSFLAKK